MASLENYVMQEGPYGDLIRQKREEQAVALMGQEDLALRVAEIESRISVLEERVYTKTETDNKFAALPVLLFNGGIPYLCDALKDSGGNSVLDSGRNEVVSRVRLNTDGDANILLVLENRIGELEQRVCAAFGHVIHDSAFKM